MKRITYRIILTTSVFLSLGVGAHAQTEDSDKVIILRIENDIFTRLDSNYTNGLPLTWSSYSLSKYDPNEEIEIWPWVQFSQVVPQFPPLCP